MNTTEIRLQRKIPASPEQVFDAWLDAANPGSPWHGVSKAILGKPEPDALFYSMYRFEDREIAHYGRFIVLDRPERIQHTWVSEATQGLESIVTIRLRRENDATLVQLVHSNLPDDEEGRGHRNAWGYVLGSLISRFKRH